YAGLGMCVAMLGISASGTTHAAVTFGGQDWNVRTSTNATATTNDDDINVEFGADGRYDLHIQRAEPDPPGININGTPFLTFSFRIDQLVDGGQIDFYLFTNQEGAPGTINSNLEE